MTISSFYFTDGLKYFPEKDTWKCLYKARIENYPFQEDKYVDVFVHFSGKGDVEYATGKDQNEIDEVFKEMKQTFEFQKNFEMCKELIEEIRDIRRYPLPDFYEFEYDYENKAGTFRFEGSLADIHFTLIPGEGIDQIYILYHEFVVNTEKARVDDHAHVLFGKEVTNILNSMIKEKLKLRYLF